MAVGTPDPTVAAAARTASTAARTAGIEVATLTDAVEAGQAAAFFAVVWSVTTGPPPVSADLIRALAHTGNYVAGAWAGGKLVGASLGFLALDQGRLSLHSHVTGVVRAARGARVGFALKQHQRAWALGRGIREITWTFDPLIRTNAEFNLVRLGAVAVAYLSEFYGEMQDGINAGDRSDRCEVRWELDSLEAVAASDGSRLARPRLDVAGRRGAVLLAVDADGGPEWPAEDDGWPDPGLRLCQVPADIVAMRTEDPERALRGGTRCATPWVPP